MQTARRLVKGPDTAETSEKMLAQLKSLFYSDNNITARWKGNQ